MHRQNGKNAQTDTKTSKRKHCVCLYIYVCGSTAKQKEE